MPRIAGWVAILAHLHWGGRRRRGHFSLVYLPARILNGFDYIDISGATAEISGDGSPYLCLSRLVISVQQRDCGHHHAWCAETTLETMLFYKALLHGM